MKLPKIILVAGVVAGALDISYAFVVYGPLSYHMSPARVLQSVAAGWVGHDVADAGGAATAFLGLVTHFMIATVMAAAFVLCATRFSALIRHPIGSGLTYGFGLYLVMTYLVVPLSAAHHSAHFAADLAEAMNRLQVSFDSIRPANRWQLLGTLFTHTVFVGLPISLINKRLT